MLQPQPSFFLSLGETEVLSHVGVHGTLQFDSYLIILVITLYSNSSCEWFRVTGRDRIQRWLPQKRLNHLCVPTVRHSIWLCTGASINVSPLNVFDNQPTFASRLLGTLPIPKGLNVGEESSHKEITLISWILPYLPSSPEGCAAFILLIFIFKSLQHISGKYPFHVLEFKWNSFKP